jgi:hypothetical protein
MLVKALLGDGIVVQVLGKGLQPRGAGVPIVQRRI